MYILYRLQPQLAVPCFGVSEYHNNADESWICTETTTIISIRVGEIFNKSNEFQKMLWIKNKYSMKYKRWLQICTLHFTEGGIHLIRLGKSLGWARRHLNNAILFHDKLLRILISQITD